MKYNKKNCFVLVEKPKALRAGGSLESITSNLYLSGHWPKDGASNKSAVKLDSGLLNTVAGSSLGSAFSSVKPTYYIDGVFKMDECTQVCLRRTFCAVSP